MTTLLNGSFANSENSYFFNFEQFNIDTYYPIFEQVCITGYFGGFE